MDQQRPEPVGPATAGDYGYDLAHDDADSERGAAAADPAPPEPVSVVTETDDQGGDYGYDLAHDVPRSG